MRVNLPPIVAKSSISDGYDLIEYVDRPGERVVLAKVTTLFGSEGYTLWEGDAYDAIGQWTDDQAADRIYEVFLEKHGADTVSVKP